MSTKPNHSRLKQLVNSERTNPIIRMLTGFSNWDDKISDNEAQVLATLPFAETVISDRSYIDNRKYSIIEKLKKPHRIKLEESDEPIDEYIDLSILEMYRTIRDQIKERVEDIEIKQSISEKRVYKLSYLLKLLSSSGLYNLTKIRLVEPQLYSNVRIYYAMRAAANIRQSAIVNPSEINFAELKYISTANEKPFIYIRDIAILFRALIISPYLFVFDGHYIETRRDALRLIKYNNYVLDPCKRCKNGKNVRAKSVDADLNKLSNPNEPPYKKFQEIMDDVNAIHQNKEYNKLLPPQLQIQLI